LEDDLCAEFPSAEQHPEVAGAEDDAKLKPSQESTIDTDIPDSGLEGETSPAVRGRKKSKKSKQKHQHKDRDMELLDNVIGSIHQTAETGFVDRMGGMFEEWKKRIWHVKPLAVLRKKAIASAPLLEDSFAPCKPWILMPSQVNDLNCDANTYNENVNRLIAKFSSLVHHSDNVKPTKKSAKRTDSDWETVMETVESFKKTPQPAIYKMPETTELIALFFCPSFGILRDATSFTKAVESLLFLAMSEFLMLVCQDAAGRANLVGSGLGLLMSEVTSLTFHIFKSVKILAGGNRVHGLTALLSISEVLCCSLGWLMRPIAGTESLSCAQQKYVWYMFRIGLIDECTEIFKELGSQRYYHREISAPARLLAGYTSYLQWNLSIRSQAPVESVRQLLDKHSCHPQGNELADGVMPKIALIIPILLASAETLIHKQDNPELLICVELLLDTIINAASIDLKKFFDLEANLIKDTWSALSHVVGYTTSFQISSNPGGRSGPQQTQHSLKIKAVDCACITLLAVASSSKDCALEIPDQLVRNMTGLPIKYFTDPRYLVRLS
jgi:hypothetical protein